MTKKEPDPAANKKSIQEHTLAYLSKNLGVSRATVSKTIRHCSGVDSETRQSILRAFRDIHCEQETGSCDLYCILPDTPSFFWKKLRCGLVSEIPENRVKSVSCKFNIYTKLHDEETVLYYLEEAESLRVRCIVIAAVITPHIREKLTEICCRTDRLVLLLSEYGDVPNSFYIGSDAYADGAEMAHRFTDFCKKQPPDEQPSLTILAHHENPNVGERLNGFCKTLSAFSGERHPEPYRIQIDPSRFSNPKTFPSYLASILSNPRARNPEKPNAKMVLYVPMGLPGLPVALKKAGIADHTVCFCHDISEHSLQTVCSADNFGVPPCSAPSSNVFCIQQIEEQGRTAMHCAMRFLFENTFPPQKKTIIPSVFRSF